MGVAGALAQGYMADSRAFLPSVAKLLQGAMPESVEILQKGLFTKSIVGLIVKIGEDHYKLVDNGQTKFEASHVHVVKGIALKTEPISVDTWIARVAEGFEAYARENAKAYAALQAFIGA